MKSQNKVGSLFLILAVALVVAVSSPVSAQPPTPNGTTILTFSSNPATLSGDGAVDVTITTTTTSEDQPDEVDNGKVIIELATDGSVLDVELNPIGGNPVPAAEVIYWMALSDPGVSPVSGITTLDVDLDALGFVCGTIGGFRAHYVTGGGKNKVDTHFSDESPFSITVPANNFYGVHVNVEWEDCGEDEVI